MTSGILSGLRVVEGSAFVAAPLGGMTLAQLGALRTANLRLYRSLGADQRKRAGLHSERGPESVEHILRMIGAHDLVHRRQIERILAT